MDKLLDLVLEPWILGETKKTADHIVWSILLGIIICVAFSVLIARVFPRTKVKAIAKQKSPITIVPKDTTTTTTTTILSGGGNLITSMEEICIPIPYLHDITLLQLQNEKPVKMVWKKGPEEYPLVYNVEKQRIIPPPRIDNWSLYIYNPSKVKITIKLAYE
jgi:hypothetical protein